MISKKGLNVGMDLTHLDFFVIRKVPNVGDKQILLASGPQVKSVSDEMAEASWPE